MNKLRAAAARAATAMEANRTEEWDVIANGVRAVGREIAGHVERGALYWRAPLQYVIEQAAPRVAKEFGIGEDRLDELRAYLLAGMNEYLITLIGHLDVEHFEAWAAAMLASESGAADAASGN